MTTLREAAQQALEALEKLVVGSEYEDAIEAERAITALHAALAEPLQGPVAWGGDPSVQDYSSCYPEPVQEPEPVAWMDREGDLYKMPEIEGWAPPHTMLYAAPPQRKPLTEEEIQDCFHAARNAKLGASKDNSKHRLSVVEIARAIERAHGIGGQDD